MRLIGLLGFLFLLLTACLFRLESVPPLSWDEGWTLSVARNWVERGHYGRLLEGRPAPGGLEASITVIAPIAFAFRLFGVGVLQGRAVGLFFLVATVVSLFLLTERLFSRSVAIMTLASLFLTGILPQWHPITIARQVLGETPMLFYLLTGYLLFYSALSRALWLLPLAIVFWALAIVTKAQVLPFWFASLLLPLLVSGYGRYWKRTSLLVTALVSSMVVAKLIILAKDHLLPALPVASVTGIYGVTALVGEVLSRKLAFVVLLFILPTVFGLVYELRRSAWPSIAHAMNSSEAIARFMLWSLVVSWLTWYLLLSNGVLRYAFPVMFIGSMFLGNLLYDLAGNKVLPERIKARKGIASQAFWGKAFIAMSSAATITMVMSYYLAPPNRALEKVVHFVQTQTPPDALIESYESELHFLIDRPYHYPPDQIHVDAMRRTLPSVEYFPLAYNPLDANPDYLIVGPMAKAWNLYGSVLQTGAFRLLRDYSMYQIYERAR